MKSLIIVTLLLHLADPGSFDSSCQVKRRAIANESAPPNLYSVCLQDPCNPMNPTPVNHSKPCPAWCKRSDGICYEKQLPPPPTNHVNVVGILQVQAQADVQKTSDVEEERRLLSTNPVHLPDNFDQLTNVWQSSSGFPIPPNLFHQVFMGCNQPFLQFPHNCNVDVNNASYLISLLDPPVNIPYCLRIPCRENNILLEFDPFLCLANPGCYYDHELAHRRMGIAGALAGVPVCHLAIRNAKFQQLAREYTKRANRKWNSLFTSCLIEQNWIFIQDRNPGCYPLKYFQYMGVKPKIAGWKNINRKSCILIDGCWVNSSIEEYHCYYPADINNVNVRSHEDNIEKTDLISQYDYFGKPLCRPFIDTSPMEYLNSYHECKQAGCVIDNSINIQSINQQFLKLLYSNLVPENIRYQFWTDLEKGSITPRNYNERLKQMKESTFCQNMTNFIPSFNIKRIASFQFTNQYYNSVILPLQRNLFEMQKKFQEISVSPRFYCLNVASRLLQDKESIFLRQLLESLCSTNSNFAYKCPYEPGSINVLGYPALKGSVEGCCEKHPCFIPRAGLSAPLSGIAAFFTEWSRWSSCDASCGGGIKTRKRKCEKHQLYPLENCAGPLMETKVCNTQACPYWRSWEDFQPCSVTCGSGIRKRFRSCSSESSPESGCVGNARESRICTQAPCPVYGNWSDYSECPCEEPRVMKRQRVCIENCERVSLYDDEEISCVRYCGQLKCLSSGSCLYPLCRKTLSCICQPEGYMCREQQSLFERCYEGFCRYF